MSTSGEKTHTPGPWGTNGSHIYAPDGEIIAVVHNPGSKTSDYPLVANRDLIAAAPNMLAALKAAVTLSDARLDCMGRTDECQAVYDMCAAAIALATPAEGERT